MVSGLLSLLVLASGQTGSAADAGRTLVVMNRQSADSVAIGQYYIKARGIPTANVVQVDVPVLETVEESLFRSDIKDVVSLHIRKLDHPIDFIVTTKGVPLKARSGSSIDALLAGMDLPGLPMRTTSQESIRASVSPYFGQNEPFSRAKFGIFLVCRLDGYTRADALRLVDNALAARPLKGTWLLDKSPNRTKSSYGRVNDSLSLAADALRKLGRDAILEETTAFVSGDKPLAGYASWGSNDSGFRPEIYHALRFQPGALAETFVSTSGRTFYQTTGGQSLIADLIKQGVTGVKGYVSEPYTFAMARPDILFDRYVRGYNLAESFYMASPIARWKDVIIGDPLCRPYPRPK